MPKIRRSTGGLIRGNLFDTNIKATSIDEDIFSDQELLDEVANDSDLVLVLDVSETPDKIKYITRTNLIGSGLVSISNNTDNYVMTGTGSALNGEANLNFDGTILTVESGEINIDVSSGDPHISFQIGNSDKFTLGVDDSDSDKFKIDSGSTVGASTLVTLDSSGMVLAGDLTVSGDDLTMGTNTSGYVLVADGTNYNPVAISGDITLASNGAVAIGSGVIVDADVNASAAIAVSKTALTAGTNISLSTNTLNVDDAFLVNNGDDATTGTITSAGLIVDGNKNVTPGDGSFMHLDTATVTDNNTSGSGTATKYTHVNIEAPTLAATNSSVTTSDAATLYINNAATAGSNQTITRNWAMWVDAGNARFDGSIYSGTTHAIDSSGLVQVANQSNITGVSTISSGTWQGTAIAHAYIADDIISGQDEITSGFAAADELMYSDGGTIKRVGLDTMATKLFSVASAGTVAQASDHMLFLDGGATGDVIVESIDDFLSAIAGSGISVSSSQLTAASGDATGLTSTSSSANEPVISVTNTHADATAGILKFVKDPGSGQGADNDVMGTITFHGTDASNNAAEELARMEAYVIEADHGSEAGGIKFYVAENDATMTAGLQVLGVKDADGEIDVTIGAGAASTTTIAGTLTMGSTAAMTNAGLLSVANQSNITGVGTISSGTWNGTAITHGYIDDDIVSGQAEITTGLIAADEMMYSDGGVIKRIGVDVLATKLFSVASAGTVAQASDHMLFLDGGATGDVIVESIDDFLSAIAGSGISVSSSQLTAGSGAVSAINNATANELVTIGSTTTELDAEANLTYDSDVLTTASSSANLPRIDITNTHAGATAGAIRFNKDSGSGDDNDVMGTIEWYGTDAAENTHERLAYIDSYIIDSAHGSEAAGLRFYVAENDATNTLGLQILGQADDNGEVDVTIGAGAASTTTIAGTLTMGSTAFVNNTGVIQVASQTNITGVGTIGTGTWEATDIAVAHGGTGVSTLADNSILTGTGASAITAEANLTFASDLLTIASSSADLPRIDITNTHAGATAGKIRFNKDSASGADDDVMGTIEWFGTDDSDNTHELLASMEAYIIEADHGSEAAGIKFKVAENDATMTSGLEVLGVKDADGEIDVNIGAGAASTTTIKGTLTMGSTAAMTNAGLVSVANQSNITGLGTISSGVWNGTAIAHGYIADDIISGQAEITTGFAAADELMYSDGGTIKRVGLDTMATKLFSVATAGTVAQASDHMLFLDGGATGDVIVESIDDFLSAIAGSGISVSSSQLTSSGGISQGAAIAYALVFGN